MKENWYKQLAEMCMKSSGGHEQAFKKLLPCLCRHGEERVRKELNKLLRLREEKKGKKPKMKL